MINLLIERFNCGRIWALVILSVLRTNDLTWLAFFRYKCNYIASIESIEFRLELKLTRSVAVMSLYSSMWGLNQACRCLWKARFCSSLNSFQHNMLKLLTVSQCLLRHRLFNWKADWFHLVHHAVLLQSFSQLCRQVLMSSLLGLSDWVVCEAAQAQWKLQNAITLGRGTQALKLDNLARHLI